MVTNKERTAVNKFLKICIPIIIMIIFTSALILHIPQSTMAIKYIKIENCVYSLSEYNIDETKVENPKMITITCDIKNKSFLKKIYNIELEFANEYDVGILTSDKIDTNELDFLTLAPRESRSYKFNFIIDAKKFSEEEVLELLKDVQFILTGHIYTPYNIKNGYLLDKEPRIISTQKFNCQVTQY